MKFYSQMDQNERVKDTMQSCAAFRRMRGSTSATYTNESQLEKITATTDGVIVTAYVCGKEWAKATEKELLDA